jgi:cell fate regulator YaaT (PSP1 superfamily)
MSKNSKLVEVVFKGERRVIYRNRSELDINEGDHVIVEADRGQDLGRVSLVGSLVRLKKGKGEARGIIRAAQKEDLEVLEKNKIKENEAFKLCKQKIKNYNLDMKLVDLELQ